MNKQITEQIEAIAKKHLGFTTLEIRHSDSFDFRTCATWSVKEALEEAYKAGIKYGIEAQKSRKG